MLSFKWNTEKNKINIKKHGVSFEEAKTVFFDNYARLIADPDHSGFEDRYIILGISEKLRLLTVCHCYRGQDSVIRIISARKSNKKEANEYRRHLI